MSDAIILFMIELVRNIINVNHEIIYFVYGLTFFVMGLAIALQSRHSSHLDLARNLNWLAAFGFLHGSFEWGDLFIPIQAEYLAQETIQTFQFLHLILLAISFSCLFGFGLALLETSKHYRWLRSIFMGLLVCWLILSLFPFRVWYTDFEEWHINVNALARYMIGLPSGFLAAYGLREYALKLRPPYSVPRIVRAMRLSGFSMVVYALAAGLIVPPVPFFPGSWLNTDTFTQYLIFPPQILRAMIALVMTLTTIRFMEIFEIETRFHIETMEQERVQVEVRERIARELHDGTIQKVYTAGLLVRSAEKLAQKDTPIASRLATAIGVLDDAITDLRVNLNKLHGPAKSPEPLKHAIQNLTTDPRFSSLVVVDLGLNLPDSCILNPEGNFHVLAILQEALVNIVRHAHAGRVSVTADCTDERLHIMITDDGIGLPAQIVGGDGLQNMRDRAALLHGTLVAEKLAKGTSIILDIPKTEIL